MNNRKAVDINEWLYRRGYSTPERKYMNPDGSATSRVFKLREKDNGELSVDVKSMTTPKKSVGNPERFFLFEIPNSVVLNTSSPQLQTFHTPLLDGSNDAHSVIVGMTLGDEVIPGILAKASKRVYF
jgi:hypothetical protein